jgi:hypothetical protein
MNGSDWARVVGYFALATLCGAALLRSLRLPRGHLLHDWSCCYLAGQLLLLTFTLSTAFLPVSHDGMSVAAIALATFAAAREVARAPRQWWRGPASVLGCLTLLTAIAPQLVIQLHRTPLIETDARCIWFLHGHALFVDNALTPSFFTDPMYLWSSPDYPLLLPAQAAWCSAVLGRWDEIGSRAFLLFHLATWFRLLLQVFSARGYPRWLALAVAFAFLRQGWCIISPGFSYISGQADYHYAVPLLLACVLLWPPRRLGDTAMSAVSPRAGPVILLLAYAANMKSESAIYVALLVAAIAAWWCVRPFVRSPRPEPSVPWRGALPAGAIALLLGLVPWALWAVFKTQNGLASNLQLAQRATTPGLLLQSLTERLPAIANRVMTDPQTMETATMLTVLGVLAGASVLVRLAGRRNVGIGAAEVAMGLLWIVLMVLIGLVYVLTPHDFLYHMETSITRLSYFPHQVVFLLCVLRIEALWAALRPNQAGSPRDEGTSTAAIETLE